MYKEFLKGDRSFCTKSFYKAIALFVPRVFTRRSHFISAEGYRLIPAKGGLLQNQTGKNDDRM
jgi:hypothetical protein